MSQALPEDVNVTEGGIGSPGTGTFLRLDSPRLLTCH
jgi:hypothetical protein